jgi:hypothetical protein
MKRYVGKKAAIATGVMTAFLAAAPGSSQAKPSDVPDASALSRGGTASEAAMDAIKSKADEVGVKVAEVKKKKTKPKFVKVTGDTEGSTVTPQPKPK